MSPNFSSSCPSHHKLKVFVYFHLHRYYFDTCPFHVSIHRSQIVEMIKYCLICKRNKTKQIGLHNSPLFLQSHTDTLKPLTVARATCIYLCVSPPHSIRLMERYRNDREMDNVIKRASLYIVCLLYFSW